VPHADGVPTTAEMLEAEEKHFKNAICVCHGFGMDDIALLGAVMRYIKGRGNPSIVLRLVREYLGNGHRFLEKP